jgi:hypothetical protein
MITYQGLPVSTLVSIDSLTDLPGFNPPPRSAPLDSRERQHPARELLSNPLGCRYRRHKGQLGVISGCAGPSAARQVNLKKRTPELDRADLKLRNLLAG